MTEIASPIPSLRALALICGLEPPPAPSSSAELAGEVLDGPAGDIPLAQAG